MSCNTLLISFRYKGNANFKISARLPSLTKRPSLVTGIHSLSSLTPRPRPRPQPRPQRSPRPRPVVVVVALLYPGSSSRSSPVSLSSPRKFAVLFGCSQRSQTCRSVGSHTTWAWHIGFMCLHLLNFSSALWYCRQSGCTVSWLGPRAGHQLSSTHVCIIMK